MIESEEYAVIVAKENDTFVGVIVAVEQNTPPYNCFIKRRLAYIIDIVVDINCRGKGVGKLLMAEKESWATQRAVEYIELSVITENVSATKLYNELGYKNTI